MVRLIIETSNLHFLIGVHTDGAYVFRSDNTSVETSPDLKNLMDFALESAGLVSSAIEEIVVDTGPGGLTSTRSGIAFANGLSFALNVPIVALNSLELMELQSQHHGADNVVVARRSNEGKFFLGFFEQSEVQKIVLGDPLQLLQEMNWQDKKFVWIGPHPKAWSADPPQIDVEFDNLLSPGLEAFELAMGLDGFANRTRVEAAVPMNELIKLQDGKVK